MNAMTTMLQRTELSQ
jgi:hypothetical protein